MNRMNRGTSGRGESRTGEERRGAGYYVPAVCLVDDDDRYTYLLLLVSVTHSIYSSYLAIASGRLLLLLLTLLLQ